MSSGVLVIFNHQEFENNYLPSRDGSVVDVKSLRSSFGKFKLKSTVFTDLNKDKVLAEIKKLSTFDFKDYSCLVIALLSHGSENDSLYGYGIGESYNVQKDIVDPIARNKSLIGKPKFIIIQACKGAEDVSCNYKPSDINSKNEGLVSVKVELSSENLYVLYSTTEGCVAFRHRYNGTPFIQTFCEILRHYGDIEDIDSLMNRTCVMFQNDSIKKGIAQFPTQVISHRHDKYIFGQHKNC